MGESALYTLPRLPVPVEDMATMNLSKANVQNIKAVQNVIMTEEAKSITMNEALTRVLSFYHKFVAFNVR